MLHDAPRGAAAHAVVSNTVSAPSCEIPLSPESEVYSAPLVQTTVVTGDTAAVDSSVESATDTKENSGSATPLVAAVASESSVDRDIKVARTLPLLATAVVRIAGLDGELISVRALVDPASQVTLVSSHVVGGLRLPARHSRGAIGLAAAQEAFVRGAVDLSIYSATDEFIGTVEARVVDWVTGFLPAKSFDVSGEGWTYLRGRQLADPNFFASASVDILLDASVFADTVGDVVVRGPPGFPVLVESAFGGLLFSHCPGTEGPPRAHSVCRDVGLRDLLEKFWTLEACVPDAIPMPEDEALAERHFLDTHRRTSDGRFVVRLPFRPGMSRANLGLSRAQALRRLDHLRLRRLTPDYHSFMTEYQSLGHMSPRSPDDVPLYYIPHHPVYKGDKLRVVFDASARTSSGRSLNDLLLVGPTIQPDLLTILLAFRTCPVALKADIIKMYRQVQVDPRDQGFQTILWLDQEGRTIDFTLSTVTYGVSSAPFLAIRCLFQLAHELGDEFPVAADVIRHSFYVDDVLTGANSVAEAAELVTQLQALLRRGRFELSKWAANVEELRSAIDFSDHVEPIVLGQDTTALGILWDPQKDLLSIRVPPVPVDCPPTRSSILSFVASIFDPLGLLAPSTVRGKLIMQELWRSDAGWRSPAAPEVAARFREFCSDIQALASLAVPRWTGQVMGAQVEYCGFADASERACAACVFVRVSVGGGRELRLVCSKTQVAPLKSVSLPRLELVACLLLARLTRAVLQAHRQQGQPVTLYSDSSIALSWLAKPSATWRCFVANRVSKIHERFPACHWRHIPDNCNPADLATRGIAARDLISADLWWKGPSDLYAADLPPQAPISVIDNAALSEQRPVVAATICSKPMVHPWFTISNDYFRLTRLFAYVIYACDRFRRPLRQGPNSPPKKRRRYPDAPLAVTTRSRVAGAVASTFPGAGSSATGSRIRASSRKLSLRPEHFTRARIALTRLAQRDVFSDWLTMLSVDPSPKFPKSCAWLNALAPFLDSAGVVRVGGCLRHADLPYAARHQSLLPTRHPWFRMWVMGLHLRYFHAGTSLVLNMIRGSHWPVPDATRVTRQVISTCIRCKRFNPTLNQRMGDLPGPRVRPAPPFAHTGIDYAGPFLLRRARGRSAKVEEKVWTAVFVCMCTKAVHLEIADGCSAAEFLDVLARFAARRGFPSHIYSDCGTNFQGTDALFRQLARSSQVSDCVADYGISWHFNPPAAPHFGGLWEAAVKSVKRHLFRAVPSRVFSRSELSSLLIQIEGCMNSRPLVPLSADSGCYEALTPAHFLIGRPLVARPVDEVPGTTSLRACWRELQAALSAFWKRWSTEYLHSMQQRPRWRTAVRNLKIDDIVVIQEATPPSAWRLGRIVGVRPGADGLVRVAQVRVANGAMFERSVRSLVPLLDEE